MAKLGPLLTHVLERIDRAGPEMRTRELLSVASHVDGPDAGEKLPVVVQLANRKPRRGEVWAEYKERVGIDLQRLNEAVSGGNGRPLYLANGLAASFTPEQTKAMAAIELIERIELDPLVVPTLMDDVGIDVNLSGFHNRRGGLTGRGVRVAVLDSGIDTQHPFLSVADSTETCGEHWDIPGNHGTHCAGSIASRDATFPGIAPDVTLLNIKVLRSDGAGTYGNINQGVDAALDRDAEILSMSLGFNHLPAWSDRGHGWACTDGRCPLCTAVDNAVSLGVIVCVAAGNEHSRADALRGFGYGASFDTELGCPGQARGAITIGAITKRSFLPADFSSRGPTSYGEAKPDLCAPGVNVMSTIRAPRLADGSLVLSPSRGQLFGRLSGTSMATPIVAGAAALLVELRKSLGLPTTPAAIRHALLHTGVTAMAFPHNVVGLGRLDLSLM